VLDFSAYNVLNGKLEGPSGFPVRSSLVNSFVVAGAASLITVAVASPAGYALGRLRIPKKNLLLLGLLGSRTLPPISIIVPFYIIGISLGLVGVLHGLIIMNLSVTLPIMTWVLMGVFASLPRDAENAARIDGCTRLQAMRYVVFPMARSGITAVGLLAFLMVYNEFLFSWILVQGTPAQTLQPTLASMWFMIGELNLMAAANGLGLLVPIVIALAFQRYITQLRLVDPVSMVLE
jgi:multiple sugar transport system permease protein